MNDVRCGTARESADARAAQGADVHYPPNLDDFITRDECATYAAVISTARARGLEFAMSGGFAVSFYTSFWRNSKDMDLCVRPRDREAMIQVTRDCGFSDYYDEKPYDRGWIYRSTRDGMLVDIIWQLANYRGEVDDAWVTLGPEVSLHGERVRLVPPEEIIWSKIHVVQRERSDWPDIMNVLYAAGERMDWHRLLERLAGEERLLGSLVLLFSWLAPGRARAFPPWIWDRLAIARPRAGVECDDDRIRRLDSRPWFTPLGAA